MSALKNLGLLWNVVTDADLLRELIHDATRYQKDDARDTARAVLVALFIQLPVLIVAAGFAAHVMWERVVQ